MRAVTVTLLLFGMASWLCAGTLTLEMRHLWGGEPCVVPTGEITTAAGETIDVTRLAYLLSKPRLRRGEQGDPDALVLTKADWFAYVEATGARSRLILRGLPAEQFDSIGFQVGLDKEHDRSDPGQYSARHPLNPVRNNLHWTPQGGYIFFALEGHLIDGGEIGGFAYHLGNDWNRVEIELPVALDLSRDVVIEVDFHLDRLLNGMPAFRISPQPATHSRRDDPVAALLQGRLGNCFSVRGVKVGREIADPAENHPERKLVGTPYRLRLPKGVPIPDLPLDYPLTNERVRLGQSLFYELKMSRSNTQACASCHNPTFALADSSALSTGDGGQKGERNAMPLFNLAWKSSFFWDGRTQSLREQALLPIENPVEMHESLDHVIEELEELRYQERFKAAFGTPEITSERMGIALEQYLLTEISLNSKFDRAARGEAELTASEKRGFELFMTEYDPRRGLKGADCFHCHGGVHFTDHRFHNNGLKEGTDRGREEVTGLAGDRNKFSTPSLRNIALTAPYMHDGRFETLREVIDHYDSGLHRSATLDPNLAKHPPGGLGLTEDDKAALEAFLRSLTDPRFAP